MAIQRSSSGAGRTGEQRPRQPVDLQETLAGQQFPADKEELVARAKQNNATEAVIVALDALPLGPYDDAEQVRDAIEREGEDIG